jgi:hypothetical protein
MHCMILELHTRRDVSECQIVVSDDGQDQMSQRSDWGPLYDDHLQGHGWSMPFIVAELDYFFVL